MKIKLSHPTANANVRAAAIAFANAGLLAEFHTTIASFPGSFLDRLSGFRPLADLNRRSFDPLLRSNTYMHPFYEAGRMIASKAGFKKLTEHEKGLFSIDSVYQNLDKGVAKGLRGNLYSGLSGVYAYEDGALQTFKEAKRLGLSCIYDLPIGYWRAAHKLLSEEREKRPAWASTLTGFGDSDSKLQQKDEELSLADQIIVASNFTATTLKQYTGQLAPIHVIPYGFPSVEKKRDYPLRSAASRLKILFVGGLSQRKGLAYLFEAVELFGNRVELTVVGRKAVDDCTALDKALSKHHWIPTLNHEEILELMKANDVLVFPSLFEGFGLVISEAMSQGTPVITTDRTAGPDLIKNNENGWIIEAGSTKALEEAIEKLIRQPTLIREVGLNASNTAALRPWYVYGNELAELVSNSFSYESK